MGLSLIEVENVSLINLSLSHVNGANVCLSQVASFSETQSTNMTILKILTYTLLF